MLSSCQPTLSSTDPPSIVLHSGWEETQQLIRNVTAMVFLLWKLPSPFSWVGLILSWVGRSCHQFDVRESKVEIKWKGMYLINNSTCDFFLQLPKG